MATPTLVPPDTFYFYGRDDLRHLTIFSPATDPGVDFTPRPHTICDVGRASRICFAVLGPMGAVSFDIGTGWWNSQGTHVVGRLKREPALVLHRPRGKDVRICGWIGKCDSFHLPIETAEHWATESVKNGSNWLWLALDSAYYHYLERGGKVDPSDD